MEIFTEEEISNKIIINDIPRKWSSIKHLHSFQINYSNSICFLKYGYLLHNEVIKQGYSYKYNYNISLLNLLTGKLEFTIPNIFKDNTQLLNLSDTKIVSYSNDNSIQIWSINGKDLKNEFTFKAEHANVLLMINIDKNRFAIVDGKVIKIYSSEAPYNEIASLRQHNSIIYCIFKLRDKHILLSWDKEGKLIFRDTELYKQIGEMKIIPGSEVSSIYQLRNGKVLIGSKETIYVINTKTFGIESIIDIKINKYDFYWGPQGKVCFLEFDNNTVLCFTENGWIRQFDCDTFTLIDIVKFERVQGVFKLNELQFLTYTNELIAVNEFY